MADTPVPAQPRFDGGRDDSRLVHAARAGDELAFRRLLHRHHRLLEATTKRFYLPGGDHDDVMQEARIGFAKAVHHYQADRNTSFRAFAAMCVTRQVATALTAARRGKQQPLITAVRGKKAEQACDSIVDYATPLDRVLTHERLERLAKGCRQLSSLERDALTRTAAGYPHEEGAGALGISRKAYDNALQRARSKLRAWEERQAA